MEKIHWPVEGRMKNNVFMEKNNTVVISRVGESITLDCRLEKRRSETVSYKLNFLTVFFVSSIFANVSLFTNINR